MRAVQIVVVEEGVVPEYTPANFEGAVKIAGWVSEYKPIHVDDEFQPEIESLVTLFMTQSQLHGLSYIVDALNKRPSQMIAIHVEGGQYPIAFVPRGADKMTFTPEDLRRYANYAENGAGDLDT